MSEDELEIYYHFEFENDKLNLIQDCFIIGCYTGMRFSDFSGLEKKQIIQINNPVKGNKIDAFKLQTKKTGEIVTIPLHPFVKGILIKHDGVPPKSYSNQKMNNYIKVICEKAGFTEEVFLRRNGTLEKFRKCEKCTTHTARRSFATNAYLIDVPTLTIMAATGHETEKSFLSYFKVTKEQHAIKLANHPFFNKKFLKTI